MPNQCRSIAQRHPSIARLRAWRHTLPRRGRARFAIQSAMSLSVRTLSIAFALSRPLASGASAQAADFTADNWEFGLCRTGVALFSPCGAY